MSNQLQRRSPRSKEAFSSSSPTLLTLPDGGHRSPSKLKSIRGGRRPRHSKRKHRFFASNFNVSYREPFLLSLVLFAFVGLVCFLLPASKERQLTDVNSNVNTDRFQVSSVHAPACTNLTLDEVSYTLVTQCSSDRLWMLQHHCDRWGYEHPISIAVYTNATAADITQQLIDLGCLQEQLSVQTLAPSADAEDYPVNALRNLALAQVQTSHVAYVDIDFWPSADLHHALMSDHVRLLLQTETKTALVVPAFQLQRQCREWRECPEHNVPVMPRSKNELVELMYDKQAHYFDPTNRGGHGSTRYKEWMTQSMTSLLDINCVVSNRYEPYLVFRYCRDTPPFQEAFSGYGKNKMTWVMQLRHMGWRLLQLGEAFVIHYPHLDSQSRLAWNGGPQGKQLKRPSDGDHVDWLSFKRGQIDQTFVEFREWLQTNVPDESLIPFCKDAMNDDEKLWIPRNDTDSSGSSDAEDMENDNGDDAAEESDDNSDSNDDGAVSRDDYEQDAGPVDRGDDFETSRHQAVLSKY